MGLTYEKQGAFALCFFADISVLFMIKEVKIMVTLLILLLIITLLLIVLAVTGGGVIFFFGWLILLIADVVIGIWLFVKIIKKLFCRKGGK